MAVSASGKTASVAPRVKRRLRRAGVVVLGCLIAGGLLVAFRHEPIVRTTLLAILGTLHSWYDTSTVEPDVNGPQQTTAVAQGASRFESTFTTRAGRQEIAWESPADAVRIEIGHLSSDIGQGEQASPTSDEIAYTFLFQSENTDSPALQPIRRQAQNLLESADNPFELCDRVRRLTAHGVGLPAAQWMQPQEILTWAQSGGNLTCQPFALLLVELCALDGFTSRMLGLSSDGASFQHAVAEVYLPEHGKWIVLDPDFNIAYRRDDRWLSAAELHDAWIALKREIIQEIGSEDPRKIHDWLSSKRDKSFRALTGIEVVELGEAGEDLRRSNLDHSGAGTGLNWYEHVFYPVRNDYLTSSYPAGHPVRVQQYLLQPDDAKSLPRIGPEATLLSDRCKAYWPVARTSVSFLPDESGQNGIVLQLATFTPNFSHFQITHSDGRMEQIADSRLTAPLGSGQREWAIRAVNRAGVRGEPTTVTVAPVPSSPDSAPK